jgi:hypothetical protein
MVAGGNAVRRVLKNDLIVSTKELERTPRPSLMITHFAAFYSLARRPSQQAAASGVRNAGRPVV